VLSSCGYDPQPEPATVVCARLFINERLSAIQALGAVLALVAIALIAAT